jgi:hypothetical protein
MHTYARNGGRHTAQCAICCVRDVAPAMMPCCAVDASTEDWEWCRQEQAPASVSMSLADICHMWREVSFEGTLEGYAPRFTALCGEAQLHRACQHSITWWWHKPGDDLSPLANAAQALASALQSPPIATSIPLKSCCPECAVPVCSAGCNCAGIRSSRSCGAAYGDQQHVRRWTAPNANFPRANLASLFCVLPRRRPRGQIAPSVMTLICSSTRSCGPRGSGWHRCATSTARPW